MIYDDDGGVYVLTSGRIFAANIGILGLGPELDAIMHDGYDGRCENYLEPALTPDERREIADEMIRRWNQWKERL